MVTGPLPSSIKVGRKRVHSERPQATLSSGEERREIGVAGSPSDLHRGMGGLLLMVDSP